MCRGPFSAPWNTITSSSCWEKAVVLLHSSQPQLSPRRRKILGRHILESLLYLLLYYCYCSAQECWLSRVRASVKWPFTSPNHFDFCVFLSLLLSCFVAQKSRTCFHSCSSIKSDARKRERGDRLEEHKSSSSSRRKYSTSVSKAVDTIHTRRTTTSVTVVVVGAGEATKSFFTLQSLVSWRDVKHKEGEKGEVTFVVLVLLKKSEYTSTLYYSW